MAEQKPPTTVTDYEGPIGDSQRDLMVKTISHGENSFNENAQTNGHPGSHRYGAKGFAERLAQAQKLPGA